MIGKLAKDFCGKELEVQVLKSAAGWYVGTWEDGPYSRESAEYFRTQQEAETALETGAWTQRAHP
jgi:hypothetical protein